MKENEDILFSESVGLMILLNTNLIFGFQRVMGTLTASIITLNTTLPLLKTNLRHFSHLKANKLSFTR